MGQFYCLPPLTCDDLALQYLLRRASLTAEDAFAFLKKSFAASNETRLQEWESEYPENQLLFVKQRLQQFMEETKDIDFAAQTIEKNNKTVFVNPAYERKSNRWKMAFRAGKEVIEPARVFVQQWINEIK